MGKRQIVSAAFVFMALCLCGARGEAAAGPSNVQPQSSSSTAASTVPTPAIQAHTNQAPEAAKIVTAYTLPPDRYKKARDKSQIDFRLALIGFVYGLVVLWIILRWKIGAEYRNWAER